MRQRSPLDAYFEAGYVPLDDDAEQAEYRRWRAAGGQVLPQLELGLVDLDTDGSFGVRAEDQP